MKKYLFLLLTLIFIPQVSFASGWPADTGYDISGALLAGTPTYEPSGLIWHKERNTLITVWAGLITEIDESGTIQHECNSTEPAKDWNCGTYYDFEGVTIADYTSDYIYLGIEDPDSIREFDISTGSYTGKYWDLTSWMTGASNSGLEGLAFVPNGYHPYSDSASGGLFYASLQATGEIFVFDVNLSSSGSVSKIDQFTPVSGRTDASDLFFNDETELLYIIYDSADYITEMQLDKTIVIEYNSLPGSNEEGFTMKPSYPASTATVYIGHDDSHNISLHANYPVSYPTPDPITDNDGDGYTEDEDCDDNDPAVHTEISYYLDADHDNYGSTSTAMVCSATAETGYSTNNTDCDDTSSSIYENRNYYHDNDADGYGAGSLHIVCSGSGIPVGYIGNNSDCNDASSSIKPSASETCNSIDDNCNGSVDDGLTTYTYYRDADSDTYGSTTTTSTCSASAPTGYVTNNTDCNDSSASIHALQIYYIDADHDNYGSTTTGQICSLTATTGYSTNNTDCNDASASVYQNVNYYNDADGDGYGAGTLHAVCSGATTPSGHTTNNTDCNDSDDTVNALKYFYIDNDRDGYGSTTSTSVCAVSAPTGYSLNNTDCDDSSISIHALQTFYIDADHDNYGSTTTGQICSTTPSTGYSSNNSDCNDNDANINSAVSYYVDSDKDSYGSTSSALVCSATATSGYSTNNTDCDDSDSSIYQNVDYYNDDDADGYGTGSLHAVCSGASMPSNHSSDNMDCNDNDNSINALKFYYVDADNDGFGSNISALVCAVYPPTGYSDNNTDCDDNNYNSHLPITLYKDADIDGLGDANSTIVVCGEYDGYVSNSNDYDDTLMNNGVEITGDKKDNDGDGVIDEVNTVEENGLHPGLRNLDPNLYPQYLISAQGLRNGKVRVTYSDESVYTYQIFNNLAKQKLIVSIYKNTANLKIKNPKTKRVVLVNGFTGEIIRTIAKAKKKRR